MSTIDHFASRLSHSLEIKLHLKQDANKPNKHLEISFTHALKKRGEKNRCLQFTGKDIGQRNQSQRDFHTNVQLEQKGNLYNNKDAITTYK